jgi:O-acetyl-ADP-ribose deacetylase (regulator of RNase III)
MVNEISGDLLNADVEALVNTVNSVGIMGKGIALQFRQAFPDNYAAYAAACKRGEVEPGKMFVFHAGTFHNPKWIINFPTKRHWKGKSKLQDIESGLLALVDLVRNEHIKSIAVPPLGCGNGGLDWNVVRKRIHHAFAELPAVTVQLFTPSGAPAGEQMRIATARPKMTAGRAAIIGLMGRYAVPGYRLALLEIQKLAYFLQCAGEPLKLEFQKQRYGPYSETLHFVLQRIEGHFVRGYGDRSRSASIAVLPEAMKEAEGFLASERETLERFQRVSALIDGYETPYGMELLSTIHWVAMVEDNAAKDKPEVAISAVQAWNEHKRKTFTPERIVKAWDRLKAEHWL